MSLTLDYTSLISNQTKRWNHLPSPPSFTESSNKKQATLSKEAVAAKAKSYAQLKDKRAWDLAIGPAKSLPMNAFILYMSGNSIQIFSMGILIMLLLNPIKAIAGINGVFAPYAPTSAPPNALSTLLTQKLAYIACNLLTLALGLYKCLQMGLLPTGTGDWLAFETRGLAPEISL